MRKQDMTMSVAVAADLDSFALVLRVGPDDADELVLAAVDASAAQGPVAVVVDLLRAGGRSTGLMQAMGNRCAHYAVPLLVAPLLALSTPAPLPAGSGLRAYPNVDGALASLPHAALPAEDRRSMILPTAATAPALARSVVAEAARVWGLPDLVFPSELVTSELVSNAVLHAATDVELLVRRRRGGLDIGVRDGDPNPPRIATHAPSDAAQLRGRGLFLVETMAKRWGYLVGSANKVVWAAIER